MDKPHKHLDVWKVAFKLVQKIYVVTANFPVEERYGLVSQIRRSAISVPSNIAEGAARNSEKDFRRFITIARGSLSELDTQLDLATGLEYISPTSRTELDEPLIRIDKMLYRLYIKLSEEPADRCNQSMPTDHPTIELST